MTEEEFNKIIWPEEFYIEFSDAQKQLFVSGPGISWDSGNNECDESENRANISCCWKKKSPSQQRHRMIHVWTDEIKSIQLVNGIEIWKGKA